MQTEKIISPEKRANRIRLIAFDVDGVLTDGKVTYSTSGDEEKSFNIRDGHGIKLAMRAGMKVAFITGRTSAVVKRRSDELGVDFLFQGSLEKIKALESILADSGIDSSEVAFLGDDLIDLPVVQRVGLGCSVADGVAELRERSHFTTIARGGEGAARELIEFILKAQGLWDSAVSKYLE